MSNRFYSENPITSDEVHLGEVDSRHLSRVMRKGVGDKVILFDGSGFEFNATISQIERKQVTVKINERIDCSRELDFDISIAAPLPKGDRQTWMMAKLVELGVRRYIPLITERSVAKPTDSALARLKKCVIESSKQCERNVLAEIEGPTTFANYVQHSNKGGQRFLADPTAQTKLAHATHSAVSMVFGPEGGLSQSEVDLAVEAGWQSVSLGKRILRLETAAVAAAAWFSLGRE